METVSFYVNVASFTLLILIWVVFAATFLLRKKPASVAPESKRSPNSIVGIALQGVGFALVWALRRNPFLSPFVREQYFLNTVLQILAICIALGSIWLAKSALSELGKQWSLTARLIEDHKLVTSGVYQIVRHPIYTAMLGMLLAAGIAYSHWLILIVATIIFLVGTRIRTSSEENLLRNQFGSEYQDYARRVPGLIPFLKI